MRGKDKTPSYISGTYKNIDFKNVSQNSRIECGISLSITKGTNLPQHACEKTNP